MNLKKEDLNIVIVSKDAPLGLIDNPRLSFDEFINFNHSIDVKKTITGHKNSSPSTIQEAIASMRVAKKRRPNNSSYHFSLSSNMKLDKAFNMPNSVKDIDLYSNFWPSHITSCYMKEQSKLFTGLQSGYASFPTIKYGGMAEWLQVVSGSIKFTFIDPTPRNLAKLSSLSNDEPLNPDEGTWDTRTLEPGEFVVVPGGKITIRKAKKDSFFLSGEFLHYKAFKEQITCLERDAISLSNSYINNRDSDIRHMYWFSAARLMSDQKSIMMSLDTEDLEYLRNYLKDLRLRSKTVTQGIYAPVGIQLQLICKDFVYQIAKSTKTIKNSKNPVNILADQTSTYNQTN